MFIGIKSDEGVVVKPALKRREAIELAERIIAQNQIIVETNCCVLAALASPAPVLDHLKRLSSLD